MVDLYDQYIRLKSEIDSAIAEVLNSTLFIKGPQVLQFEKSLAEYLNVKHVISCANGTDALTIALMSLGLNPGDEIITTTFSFIATAESITFLGLKPVFADVDDRTFNIDCSSLKKLLTSKTKAIIPVHLFGQCGNLVEIKRFAEKYNLFIIEDAAQALGSDFFYPCGTPHKAGTLSNIGCTSFFPSKNLACFGDGGALFTNDDLLVDKIRSIANHGMREKYVYEIQGMNSRLDSIQAAVLNVKLKYLDEFNLARNKVADFYDNNFQKLKGIDIPERSKFSTHIFHQYTLKVKNGKRNELKTHLEKSGIPTMVYYPKPLHLQKSLQNLGYKPGDFKVSEKLSEEVLSLPMHTELNEEQLQYIIKAVMVFFN